jgi:iron complex outermembrane receptor protein
MRLGFLVAVTLLVSVPTAGQQVPTNATPPAPANATPPAPDVEELPEVEETVVVSATRSDRRLQDEPLRVEVIDREEIEEKALMTPGSVAMLLGETTGLRVQTTAPSIGAANVRIQGLRGRYAQLLADGLPLYGSGGDSFSMLQVPPLDLGQVEVIKGAASALYGPAALGGVINLVSRRPGDSEREALFNATSQQGADLTLWIAEEPRAGWAWTLLGGFHGQPRQDLDGDEWTDLAGYRRVAVRPRVFFDTQRGGSLLVTAGVIAEDREGGAPRFAERLDTRRADGGALARWLAGEKVVTVRGSFARLGQDRTFGDVREQGTRITSFAEAAVTGAAGRHTWVVGGAFQQDRYDPEQIARFAYRFTAPAIFAQDEMTLGSRASLSASARADFHSEYGTLVSPRVSLLLRPADAWTARVSAGTGSFAPTPFTEETDETGLARVAPLTGLVAERARTASADVSWTRGPFEISGTLFGSVVDEAVQLAEIAQIASGARDASGAVIGPAPFFVALFNAPEPTRTWGTELIATYRRGELITRVTHGYTRSTEYDLDTGRRREVPLTPRHAASFNVMWEGEAWGRLGLEAYYTGRQTLDDNPYRDVSRRYLLFGGLFERRVGAARLFINVENLADIRQTKYDPLIRPARLPDGRWTVEAWAPLDGRVWNGGLRVSF